MPGESYFEAPERCVNASMALWRVAPIARPSFGPRTVWFRSEDSARQMLGVFSEGLADPVGLWVAEVVPEYVFGVPDGRLLESRDVLAHCDRLIAEAVGHRWLALWDGPRAGGAWETWINVGDDLVDVRPVPERDAEQWTIPSSW